MKIKNFLIMTVAISCTSIHLSSLASSHSTSHKSTASNDQVTIINNTPFTFFLDSTTPSAGSNNECVSSAGTASTCHDILAPFDQANPTNTDNQQSIKLSSNYTSFDFGYFINEGNSSSYYSIHIQDNNGTITTNAPTAFATLMIFNPHTSSLVTPHIMSSFNNANKVLTLSLDIQPPYYYPSQTSHNVMTFTGFNLSGMEAGDSTKDGKLSSDNWTDWEPSIMDAQYFILQGANTVRIPINWNFLTPSAETNNYSQLTGPNEKYYLNSMLATVKQLLTANINVILDLHSYMRYGTDQQAGNGKLVNTDQVNAVWTLLANYFHDTASQYDGKDSLKPQLIFEIMNEPNSMPTATVLDNDKAGLQAIRTAGLSNLVLLEGNSWSGLHSWLQVTGDESDGLSNAEAFTPTHSQIKDNNYAIAVHQYFDSNGSGTSATCQSLNSFKDFSQINAFTNWVKTNKVKVLVTEFGSGPVSGNPEQDNCAQDVNWFLQQMEGLPYSANTGGFLGWTAWYAGHAYTTINKLTPSTDGHETTQMTQIYEKHLTPPSVN